jgi:hypothetical protein
VSGQRNDDAAFSSRPAGVVVRPARAEDVDRVLDLLTHYEQPRSLFAPWYQADPTYRPEQSWPVEENGRLVAHLRIYSRVLRTGGGACQSPASAT